MENGNKKIKYNIAVIGAGYVGLSTALCFAKNKYNVTCVDMDKEKIKALKQGHPIYFEPGLQELMLECQDWIKYTDDYSSAYKNADVIFIAVNTPESEDGSADLRYLYEAVDQILSSVEKNCLIIIRSTVPVGTTDELNNYISLNTKTQMNKNLKIEFAFNPEFLSQGAMIDNIFNPSRIIIGSKSEWSRSIMKELFSSFSCPIIEMDIRSAEMTKYASNCFLALKISYINEIAKCCEIFGADIQAVTKGMAFDSRIGESFLKAGVGYGGSCLPKDTKALYYHAKQNGITIKTIQSAIEVNETQILSLYNMARKKFESLDKKAIAILGLSFKPGTDDLRNSSALENIRLLLKSDVILKLYDPVSINVFRQKYLNTYEKKENIYLCNSIDEALHKSDMCFIFTEWDCIKKIEISKIHSLMRTPIVFDGRNIFDRNEMKKAGIKYYCIGSRMEE